MEIDKEKLGEMYSDIKWIKKFIADADKKYAKKWVEKLGVGLVSTILVAVIGALLGLVLVQPVHALASLYINLVS